MSLKLQQLFFFIVFFVFNLNTVFGQSIESNDSSSQRTFQTEKKITQEDVNGDNKAKPNLIGAASTYNILQAFLTVIAIIATIIVIIIGILGYFTIDFRKEYKEGRNKLSALEESYEKRIDGLENLRKTYLQEFDKFSKQAFTISQEEGLKEQFEVFLANLIKSNSIQTNISKEELVNQAEIAWKKVKKEATETDAEGFIDAMLKKIMVSIDERIEQEKWIQAIQAIEQYLSLGNESKDLYFKYAYCFYKAKKYNLAIDNFLRSYLLSGKEHCPSIKGLYKSYEKLSPDSQKGHEFHDEFMKKCKTEIEDKYNWD